MEHLTEAGGQGRVSRSVPGMQLFCLQLEASCLQWSFSTYSCVLGAFLEDPVASLNKEVRPFFLSDNNTWSFPSVSSLSDYSIWRS